LVFHFLKNDPSEIVQSMHKKLYRPESVIGEISAFGWYWLLLLGCLIISNFISPSPVALGNRRFFSPSSTALPTKSAEGRERPQTV
jgi:hypothetical protein